MIQRGLSFLMLQGVVLAGPTCSVPSQPGFKVAPEIKRLRHQIQPVPHTLSETQCFKPKQTSKFIKHYFNKHNIFFKTSILYKVVRTLFLCCDAFGD